MNVKAPVEDQRKVLIILRDMESTISESIKESELIVKALDEGIDSPADSITELIVTGHLYRTKTVSGIFIRRTEK